MIRLAGRLARDLERWFWNARARMGLRLRGASWSEGLSVRGPLGLSVLGSLRIGANVTIVSSSKFNRAGINHPTQLAVGPGATLSIGSNTGISGAAIFCAERIDIGNHVLIGANCNLYDTDFHPLNFADRRANKPPKTSPIIIGDDVWLGANVTVLKGVTIGARSVIAAGSVVVSDVPEDTLAGGVPAHAIKSLA